MAQQTTENEQLLLEKVIKVKKANEILKIIERKEADSMFFNRCIKTKTCPECGKDLDTIESFLATKLSCPCGFAHYIKYFE